MSDEGKELTKNVTNKAKQVHKTPHSDRDTTNSDRDTNSLLGISSEKDIHAVHFVRTKASRSRSAVSDSSERENDSGNSSSRRDKDPRNPKKRIAKTSKTSRNDTPENLDFIKPTGTVKTNKYSRVRARIDIGRKSIQDQKNSKHSDYFLPGKLISSPKKTGSTASLQSDINLLDRDNDMDSEPETEKDKADTSKDLSEDFDSEYVLPRNPQIQAETRTLTHQKEAADIQEMLAAGTIKNLEMLNPQLLHTLQQILKVNTQNRPTTSAESNAEVVVPMQTSPLISEKRFTYPKKTFPINTQFEKRKATTTKTSNRLEPLQNLAQAQQQVNTAARQSITKPKSPTSTQQATATRKPKVPPIVIDGAPKNHKELVNEIKQIVKQGFYIKYSFNTTLVYVDNIEEHKRLKENLVNANKEFHTYTPREERKHAFVFRRLNPGVMTDEIKKDLQDAHNTTILEIYQMKTQARPLYLVVMDKDVTLRQLNNEIRFVLNTKISWEHRANQRRITQCRRCQQWGHAATNCAKEPRCMKCAESHRTYDCTKSPDVPAKCINCGGDHTASNVQCEAYRKRIEILEMNDTRNQQAAPQSQYVPAPAPKVNPWTRRAEMVTSAPAPTSSGPTPQPKGPPPSQPKPRPLSQCASASAPAATSVTSPTTCNPYGEMQELFTEIRELRNHINISQAILALRELKKLISTTKTPMEKIWALERFESTVLPNYDI